MNSGTYAQTHENILKNGKTSFLRCGFERANLREICKASGVTTGAFYRHFKDKEDLFSALVEPAIQGLQERYSAYEAICFKTLNYSGLDEMHKVSAEVLDNFICYIFDHLEAFKLLLCNAGGTKYSEFTNWLVEREIKDIYKTYDILEKSGMLVYRISEKELHMLTHAFFSCIFETVLHDFSKEDAVQSMKTLSVFFSAGWKKILSSETI